MRTEYRECGDCHTRLIFARTATGGKLPAAEHTEDPEGTMAIWHRAPSDWVGCFLAKDEQPAAHETRHAVHHCEARERRQQRGNWTSAVNTRRAGQRRGRSRRTTAPPDILPGMTRLHPRKDQP